jgi:hypothetical protein
MKCRQAYFVLPSDEIPADVGCVFNARKSGCLLGVYCFLMQVKADVHWMYFVL